MTTSRKASLSVVRFVRCAIDATDTGRETIEVAKAGLLRVAAELGRLASILDEDRLWDTHDVARFLGVHRNWVYQQAEAGTLPCVRMGGLVRFEPATVRALAAGERVNGGRRVVLPVARKPDR